jgi:hypothetical protein
MDSVDLGPPVVRVAVEGWDFLAIRRDLVPCLLSLGRYVRRSGIPLGSDLPLLLEHLERRYAALGTADQDGAAFGKGREGDRSKVYSVSEVAFLSGMSVRTIRGLAGGDELPGRRSAAGWMLDGDGVERFLAEKGVI